MIADEAMLGRTIGAAQRRAHEAGHARDRDDLPATRLHHARQQSLRQRDRCQQVHGHDLLVDVEHGIDRERALRDAGVVDEPMDRAAILFGPAPGLLGERRNARIIRRFERQDQRRRLAARLRLAQRSFIASRQDQACTTRRERFGQGSPDPRRRSRYPPALSLEHLVLPCDMPPRLDDRSAFVHPSPQFWGIRGLQTRECP